MGTDADRHLLFGLIALQVGLIDPSQLVAAFQSWARDKSRPIADHLAERGAIDADGRAAVEAMVALHLKKHGGDVEKSLGDIPAGPSTRRSLAAVADTDLQGSIAQIGSRSTEADSDRTATYAVGESTGDGRRFRVLRPHARGGLGAVFVALDAELNREVALKQILDQHADNVTCRQRFLLEAEVTGGLEHPGIVPVYSLGTYADGRPFYAMRFVKGDNLKEAADAFHADEARRRDPGRWSLGLRELLNRFTDVCDAIEYAHSRGVLHRDIKPGNVIVGKHGETLVVDWGLAKAKGRSEPAVAAGERTLVPSSSGSSAQTQPGSMLGTPAYMSPEQAVGDLDRLGTRSDIYSLGATLYYLLTGRPPFEGDVADVIGAVQKGRFPLPRQLNSRLDPALEAVCLKAMALDPADRHGSARDLAGDIERWMADEPVSAYRESFGQRAARWARRNRNLVLGGVTVLLVATVGLAITGVVISREKRVTEAALARAIESDSAALGDFRNAVRSVIDLLDDVADQTIVQTPGLEPLRKSLIDKAVRSFDAFRERRPDDGILLYQCIDVYSDAAIITSLVGDTEGARRLVEKQIQAIETMMKLPNGDGPLSHLMLVDACRAMVRFLKETGHDREASPYVEKARDLADTALARFPELDPALQDKSRTIVGSLSRCLAEYAFDTGQVDWARRECDRTIDLLSAVTRGRRNWYWYRLYISQAHRVRGRIAAEVGDPADAEREFLKAVEIERAVLDEHRDAIDPPRVLATTLLMYGPWLATRPGREAEADRVLDEAVERFDKLARMSPAVPEYQKDRAAVLLARGSRHAATGRDSLAEKDLVKARELFADVSARVPGDWTCPGYIGRVETALGRLRLRQRRAEEAGKHLDEAVRQLEQACRYRPEVVVERRSLDEARKARDEAIAAGPRGREPSGTS